MEVEPLRYIVAPDEDGEMLQKILKRRFRFSRRMFRRLKMAGDVLVNGKAVYLTSRVREGDQVTVFLEEEGEGRVVPESLPLSVVYEDADLIVIDKQPGVVVHPTKDYKQGTLANGLAYYWAQKGEQHWIRPVTRLDRDTSGLLVFAKHAYAHSTLATQMAKGHYRREYIAIVHGAVPEDQGTIEAPIARCPERPSRRHVAKGGAHATTHFRVLERYRFATLLQLRLETGRTHQIRVHLAYIGHSIIGDPIYGNREETYEMSRQALHASSLQLTHPRDGNICSWVSPLPQDMEHLKSYLNNL